MHIGKKIEFSGFSTRHSLLPSYTRWWWGGRFRWVGIEVVHWHIDISEEAVADVGDWVLVSCGDL